MRRWFDFPGCVDIYVEALITYRISGSIAILRFWRSARVLFLVSTASLMNCEKGSPIIVNATSSMNCVTTDELELEVE